MSSAVSYGLGIISDSGGGGGDAPTAQEVASAVWGKDLEGRIASDRLIEVEAVGVNTTATNSTVNVINNKIDGLPVPWTLDEIRDIVWDKSSNGKTVLEMLEFSYDINGGRWKLNSANNTMTLFKADNTTVVATFDMFDFFESPTVTTIAERKRV